MDADFDAAPDRRIENVQSEQDLERLLPDADLLLVNRVLDGEFGDASGIALIARLAGEGDQTPAMMLISNLPDAQGEAAAAGALEGFGKRDLNSPQAQELVQAALDGASDTSAS